jgi:hypothetical protein
MARDKAPTGKEISDKARAGRLDTTKVSTGEKAGKKSTFTPAHLGHLKKIEDLEDGQLIGVLDTEIAGDRANLPPGKYNMFIAKVGGDWQVYFGSGEEIVAKAASVVERKDTPNGMKPRFREGSFCWWVWLVFSGFEVCV